MFVGFALKGRCSAGAAPGDADPSFSTSTALITSTSSGQSTSDALLGACRPSGTSNSPHAVWVSPTYDGVCEMIFRGLPSAGAL